MTGPDRRQTELYDTGDAWLAFVGLFVLASIATTAVLWQYVSFYWALAGAVPPAIVVAWALSLIRPVRRVVAAIVEWVFAIVDGFFA